MDAVYDDTQSIYQERYFERWYKQNLDLDFSQVALIPEHGNGLQLSLSYSLSLVCNSLIRNATALQISTIILSASSGFFIFIWISAAGLKWSNHRSKSLYILRVAASSRNKKHIPVSVIYIYFVYQISKYCHSWWIKFIKLID